MSTKNTKKCTPGGCSNSGAPSNWCTYPRARGFLLSLRCRSNSPAPAPSPGGPSCAAAANRVAPLTSETRKRLRDLERDIDRLKARIRQENRRHMIAKRTRSSRPVGEEREAGKAPVAAAAARFPDGSFLHEMSTRIGKPWERLCMHVSLPTLAEDATSAAEVLERFTKMKIGDLCRCLMSLMPMAEVTGLKVDTSRAGTGKPPSPPYYPDDGMQFLTESILFASVREFEDLALEGLKIQMCSTRRSNSNRRTGTGTGTGPGTDLDAKKTGRSTDRSDWVVLVALIQMRDPREDYGPVGELMIGLIEAQLGRNGELQFGVEGVHVAGLNLARSKIAGRDFLWSVSLEDPCGGSDGSRAMITRNPNHLFPPPALGKN